MKLSEFLCDIFGDFGSRRLGSARAIMAYSFLTRPNIGLSAITILAIV